MELHLSPFGIQLSDFLMRGDSLIGDSNLAAILRERIERHQLGCELLVCGHDHTEPHYTYRRAHILVVSNEAW